MEEIKSAMEEHMEQMADLVSEAVMFSYINMDPRRLDPEYSGEILKHLDKQNELLSEAYKSMLNEVQKLQVEEEMLMRKLYEIMSAHGLTKKNVDNCNA